MALRTTEGEVMAKILVRRTAKTIELASFNPAHPNLVVPVDRVDWMARNRLGEPVAKSGLAGRKIP